MEYVYHMRDPKRALLFLQDLHRELVGILDGGVIFLMDNGVTDWYIFVNADHSALEHVEALLTDKGERSKYTVKELSTHPTKLSCAPERLSRSWMDWTGRSWANAARASGQDPAKLTSVDNQARKYVTAQMNRTTCESFLTVLGGGANGWTTVERDQCTI